jgi:hypothetical protein
MLGSRRYFVSRTGGAIRGYRRSCCALDQSSLSKQRWTAAMRPSRPMMESSRRKLAPPQAARYSLDAPAIAQFLGRGHWLISKVRVSRLDRARDAIDLAPATVDAVGLVEHTIFGEDLADGRAPTCARRSSRSSGSLTPRTWRVRSSTLTITVPPAVLAKATRLRSTPSREERSRLNSRGRGQPATRSWVSQ